MSEKTASVLLSDGEAHARPVPARTRRLSERPLVRLAIRVFGYGRVAAVHARYLRLSSWAKLWRHDARNALSRRRECIAALRAATSAADASRGERRDIVAAPAAAVSAPAIVTVLADMKAALFIPSFLIAVGGTGKVAGRLAELLARSNAKVDLFCRPPASSAPPYPVDNRVRIRHLIEHDDRQLMPLRRESYDLAIGFAMPNFYARVAHVARALEVPLIVQECTNPKYISSVIRNSNFCRDDSQADWLRQAVFAHANAVRFTVPVYAESVLDGIKPFAYAFYNAFVPPGRDRRRATIADRKFVCVSALKDPNKNGLVALDAFCRVASRKPGCSLHLYGVNNFIREMNRLREQYPDADIVDHGIVHDIGEIYRDAYSLIIPSYEEGLPNVVVEAFSYGVPCIGFSDCIGVKAIIRHESNGLLVDRADPLALQAAIERMTDPDIRQSLSGGAGQFADENFRLEIWQANWLRLIDNAAKRLNNRGQPQLPMAQNFSDRGAKRWSDLLDTYLQFGP